MCASLLIGCDASQLNESQSGRSDIAIGLPVPAVGTPEFALARKGLDQFLIRRSVDEVYVRLNDEYVGFAGIYEDEAGNMVVRSTDPVATSYIGRQILNSALDLSQSPQRVRDVITNKNVRVESTRRRLFAGARLPGHRRGKQRPRPARFRGSGR